MTKKSMLLLIVSIFLTSISLQTAVAQTWNLTGNANANAASQLGTTNNFPVNITTNGAPRITVDPLGKVGIGTTTPLNILTVQLNGSVPAAAWIGGGSPPVFMGFAEEKSTGLNLLTAGNAAALRPVFNTRRSRGTLATPLPVKNNDYLASFVSSGYDGSDFQNPASIDFYVDGIPSAGSVPGRISFVTGSNVGNRVERLKVGNTGNFNFNDNQLTLTQATGNVGIGTTTPTLGKLVIDGAVGNTVAVFRGSSTGKGISLVTDWPGIYFNSYFNGSQKALSSGYAGILNFDPVSGNIYLGASAAPATSAGDAIGVPASLLINKDGNVGVGTQTPSARLQVSGNNTETRPIIQATNTYSGNSDVRGISSVSKAAEGWGYGIEATGGYRGGSFVADAGAYSATAYGVYGSAIGTAGTRYGVYGTATGPNAWGGYFPAKTYTSELRVGGTTGAAGYVAAINGRLIATEVRVELINNWPDYVFKKGYDLMSIENLEAKINADNHLPGIPAASEMKENGIMLGEMQTKTIEKVEENTLYIIQLNNKIKLLEDKIEELTKKIK